MTIPRPGSDPNADDLLQAWAQQQDSSAGPGLGWQCAELAAQLSVVHTHILVLGTLLGLGLLALQRLYSLSLTVVSSGSSS